MRSTFSPSDSNSTGTEQVLKFVFELREYTIQNLTESQSFIWCWVLVCYMLISHHDKNNTHKWETCWLYKSGCCTAALFFCCERGILVVIIMLFGPIEVSVGSIQYVNTSVVKPLVWLAVYVRYCVHI